MGDRGDEDSHSLTAQGQLDTIAAGPVRPGAAEPREGATPSAERTLPAGESAASDEGPGGLPSRIGRYVVIEAIGEGGMGLVFAAYDPKLDRKVAVKLVRPALRGSSSGSSGDPHRRLLREAQVLAKLSHPNIIHVYEVGSLAEDARGPGPGGEAEPPGQGTVFITMEYFEGPTLKRWQDRAHVSWREILAIYRAAGRGLEAAHAAGLVHRDFKAENVLVGDDGQVRVIDFGLAREGDSVSLAEQLGDETAAATLEHLTMTGAIMGTPAYMAPEQHGGGEIDARTDQFSFCVSLYEALYGERPFAGATLAELTANVLAGNIQPAPRFEQVPAWVRRVLLRGLSVDPKQRYPSLGELLRELDRNPVGRGRWVLAGLAAAGLAALGWIGVEHGREVRRAQAEGERLRVEFGRARASDAEGELHRLRARTAAQRWDDLVLAWAKEQLDVDPTRALAALHRLDDLDASLGAARTIAASAWQRGVARQHAGLSGDVVALGVTDAGDFLVTLDRAGVVRSWELAAQGPGPTWTSPEPVRALAVAHAGRRAAIGTSSGTIFVLEQDPEGAPALRSIAAHEGSTEALAFSADDGLIVSAGADQAVRRWSVATGERVDAMNNLDGPLVAVASERGGEAVATASASGEIGWWVPSTAKVHRSGRSLASVGPPRALAALDGVAWYVRGDGVVMSWQPGLSPRPTEIEEVAALQVTAGAGLLVAHEDGRVSWTDGDPETPARPLLVSAPARHLALAPAADAIIVAGPELGVQRWDVTPDFGEVWSLDEGASALRFSPSGRELAIAGNRGSLRLRSLDGQPTREAQAEGRIVRMSFSPSGEQLAVQLIDGAIELREVAEPSASRTLLDGHETIELVGSSDGAPHPELVWTEDGEGLAFGLCRYADYCLLGVLDVAARALRGEPVPTEFVSTLAPTASGDAVLVGRRDQPIVAVFDPASGEVWSTRFEDAEVLGQAWAEDGDGRVRVATQQLGQGGVTLSVWSWDPVADQRHRLFDEPGFVAATATEGGAAVYLDTGEKTAVLWSIAGTRFLLIPQLPPGIESIALSPGGETLLGRGWEPDSGAGLGYVLDLDAGQGRRLPRLLDPLALSAAGIVADYRVGEGVRVWEDPTPADVEGFRAWLERATDVRVGVEVLAAPVAEPRSEGGTR